MHKAAKQKPGVESSFREKMFRIAESVRAQRVPAYPVQSDIDKKVCKASSWWDMGFSSEISSLQSHVDYRPRSDSPG